jgi:hypothetical protein
MNQLYGRHGDIKPENFLWHKGNSGTMNIMKGDVRFEGATNFGVQTGNEAAQDDMSELYFRGTPRDPDMARALARSPSPPTPGPGYASSDLSGFEACPGSNTISQDRTAGEKARKSALLADLGKKRQAILLKAEGVPLRPLGQSPERPFACDQCDSRFDELHKLKYLS